MSSNIKKMRITVEGKAYDVTVEMLGEPEPANYVATRAPVNLARPLAEVAAPVAPPPAAAASAAEKPAGAVPSPLAGTVVAIHVSEGQSVKAGDLLVTLEAMKMNTPIRAPSAGTVRQLAARQGAVIEEGATLLVLE
ncbi:MAG: biotin/lipoyl-containing protein [Myxococcales bacterium]|jgi:biotin carboxyl carrier protein